jgi:hypothetical protein
MGISGTKPSLKKFQTLNSQQKSVLKDLLKHLDVDLPSITKQPLFKEGQSYLSSLLSQDPEMMKQFEEPAMRQFQEEIVPQVAERFSGLGAQSSSAFNQAMGQQAGSLAERLASMRAGLGMNAAQLGMGYAQLPFQQGLQEEQMKLARTGLGLGTQPWGYQAFGGQAGVGQAAMGGLGQALGMGGGLGIMSGISKLFGF